MLMYLLGLVIFLCIIHVLFNYNRRARLIKKIPGPRDDFIVGNGWTVIRSPVEVMKMGRELAGMFDGIFRVWVYPMASVLIYNPKDIEIVVSNVKYSDKSMVYTFLKPWLRDGLLLSKGAKWQERRKILTPTFHFNILKQFSQIIEENSQRFVEGLKQTAGKPIDIVPELSNFTLHSICETAMGTKLSEDTTGVAKSYKDAIYEIGLFFLKRFVRIYLYPDFMFNLSPMGRSQNKYLNIVHNFTKEVIEQRKELLEKVEQNTVDDTQAAEDDDLLVYKRKKKAAMLDLLISAEKEGRIDKIGVQEEVDTFMFEGHDTTASGLTFCFMLLANHRKIQDKIF